MAKPGKTAAKTRRPSQQSEEFAQVLKLIRHVRNFHEIGPHPIRMEATQAEEALERALGTQINEVYRTKTWKSS